MATEPLRGHIYFGKAAGETKQRPWLVVSENIRNARGESVVVVPITSQVSGGPWHVQLTKGEAGLRKKSELRCENLLTIRKAILCDSPLDGPLSAARLDEVREAILKALGFLP